MSFRIKGIRFDVSFYFFALLTAFFLLEPDSITACGALAAAVHESGHLAAMLAFRGCRVEQVRIGVCGLCITANMRGNQRGWIPICVAGAAANLLLTLITLPLLCFSSGTFATAFASANMCIGIVNLMPVEPLDGGQLLRAILLRKTSPEQADKISFWVSIIFLTPFIIAGLWLLMKTRFNFSLLMLGLWLLAGILGEYI